MDELKAERKIKILYKDEIYNYYDYDKDINTHRYTVLFL